MGRSAYRVARTFGLIVAVVVPLVGGAAAAGAVASTVFSARTSGFVVLADGGGVSTTVESLSLPKGSWTVTSNVDAIENSGNGDFVRCRLDLDGTGIDGGSTAFVEGTVADLANSVVLATKAAATVAVTCSHDRPAAHPSDFGLYPGATLLAVKGGPISGPTAAKTGANVVEQRSTASTPLAEGALTDVTSVDVGTGTWAVRANLSAVTFNGFDWVDCQLVDSSLHYVDQQVAVGNADDVVTPLSVQNVFKFTAADTVRLRCGSSETTSVYIDQGATLTATRMSSPTDIVTSTTRGVTLADTGGTRTRVFHEKLPAGAWRVNTAATTDVYNPNGSLGGAIDFVRCYLFDGKKAIDGGAVVRLVALDGDPGNIRQMILNTATVTTTKPWTLNMTCAHDNTISTGSHWAVYWTSPIIAVRQGPIRSTVT